MIVTAEQAAALPSPFVVDGEPDTDPLHDYDDICPPKKWADLDRPCPFCEDGFVDTMRGDLTGICDECHGTGRHVEELWCYSDDAGWTNSLGLFTIQVLPIEDEPRMLAGMVVGALATQDLKDMGLDARPGQYLVIATKVET